MAGAACHPAPQAAPKDAPEGGQPPPSRAAAPPPSYARRLRVAPSSLAAKRLAAETAALRQRRWFVRLMLVLARRYTRLMPRPV